MKKWIVGIIGILILTSNAAWAITKLESVKFDFSNGSVERIYHTGTFNLVNQTAPNGDNEQVNEFIWDGGQSDYQASGNKFWTGVSALVKSGAVNMDVMTNQDAGQTGVYYGPDEISVVDTTTNTVLVNNAQ